MPAHTSSHERQIALTQPLRKTKTEVKVCLQYLPPAVVYWRSRVITELEEDDKVMPKGEPYFSPSQALAASEGVKNAYCHEGTPNDYEPSFYDKYFLNDHSQEQLQLQNSQVSSLPELAKTVKNYYIEQCKKIGEGCDDELDEADQSQSRFQLPYSQPQLPQQSNSKKRTIAGTATLLYTSPPSWLLPKTMKGGKWLVKGADVADIADDTI